MKLEIFRRKTILCDLLYQFCGFAVICLSAVWAAFSGVIGDFDGVLHLD